MLIQLPTGDWVCAFDIKEILGVAATTEDGVSYSMRVRMDDRVVHVVPCVSRPEMCDARSELGNAVNDAIDKLREHNSGFDSVSD